MSVITTFPSYVGQKTNAHQKPITNKTTTAPPGAPSKGDRYIIPAGATGDWATYTNYFAEYVEYKSVFSWFLYPPIEGMKCYDNTERVTLRYDGTNWVYDVPTEVEKQATVLASATTNIVIGAVAAYHAAIIDFTLEHGTTPTIRIGGRLTILYNADNTPTTQIDEETWGYHDNQTIDGITFDADVNAGNMRLLVTSTGITGSAKLRYKQKLIGATV